MNSRSARRLAILSTPKSRRTCSRIAIRSLVLELPRLVEHPPAHGNGDGAVDDADHQDVDVAATQPPVGPVHGQPPRPRLEPHHRDQELGEAIVIEIDLLEKPLQAPIVGAGSRRAPESGRPSERGSPSGRRTRRRPRRKGSPDGSCERAKPHRSVSRRALIGLSRMISLLTRRGVNRESYNLFQRPT